MRSENKPIKKMHSFLIIQAFLMMVVFHMICKASDESRSVINVGSTHSSLFRASKPIPQLSIEAYNHSLTITTNVCNMSLIASIENEDAIYKKCICNDKIGDVECGYLGVTELPKLISFPKNIQIANFRGNRISSLVSENFYNGHDVIELDLSNNRIDFISNSALKNFNKLMWLDFSHNRIWNVPKAVFEGLHNLRRLDLSFNKLIYLSHFHFSNLTELRDLNLKFNPLQDLNSRYFEKLVKLESLNLESTMLKFIPDDIFTFNSNIRLLNLAGNKLPEVPTAALGVLHKLRVLDLSGNLIKVIHPESFKGLKELERLYLDRLPHLKRIENYAFGNVMHLQELHCSYNLMLTVIAPHSFARKIDSKKVSLSHLILKQNNLKRISHSLLQWNYDVELDLRDNPLHCDCHIAWMMHTSLKNNYLSHTKCHSPPEFENRAIKELKGQVLRCDSPSPASESAWMVCSIVLILTAVILTSMFLIWRFKNKRFSRTGFFKVKKKDIEPVDYYGRDDDI